MMPSARNDIDSENQVQRIGFWPVHVRNFDGAGFIRHIFAIDYSL